ncbi:tetratricopeptide repeat protein [Opitutus terrae]|uniref:TPR repeat-containing protein n=1 Tax=Opitutus terrae (strain DSM 11246 / JCM 15787 / PB90-1) TaxID=452637 RepID=B1ZRT9_OPITP|nr:tetratricopeptide repeat protein [Opitutus terrae]ACB73782.1 TPR repeat-containing protein [Opitutus terrae PB90-1]
MTRRQLILGLVLVAATAVAGTAAFRLWREQSRAARAWAALPPTPNLIRWPAEMVAAVQEAAAAVRASRDPVKPLGQLAMLYVANGFGSEAERLLHALRRLQPKEARWPYLLAELHRRAGDRDRVEQALEMTVALAPDYAPAWLRLGDLMLEQKLFGRAQRCFQQASLVAPGEVRTRFAVIAFEARHGRRTDPRPSLIVLARDNPGIRELHELLAQLHAAAGDPVRAQQEQRLLERADRRLGMPDPWMEELLEHCYEPNRLQRAAQRFAAEKRLDLAESLLRRATSLSPADPTPRSALAQLLVSSERIRDARTVLEQALVECPDEPMVPIALARVLCQEHKPLEAVAIAQAALACWPEHAGLHAAVGYAWRDARENETALAALREALRLNPTLVEAQYNLAFCLMALRQREAAQVAVQRALTLRPDYPEALVMLGGLELDNGDVAAAQRHILALFELRPDEPGSRLLYAALHHELGNRARDERKFEEADRRYRAGLEVSPQFAPLLHEGALLAARRAQYGQVVEWLERYLRLAPRDLEAYILLAEAYREIQRPELLERALERGSEMAAKIGDTAKHAEFETRLDQLY